MTDWFKKLTLIAVLGALTFLRIVDLAYFDADHDHIDRAHIQAHLADIPHSHEEGTVHEAPEVLSVHLNFHTLLSAYLAADDVEFNTTQRTYMQYQPSANEQAFARAHRPPVPPPLA